jgi:hypothetical protein
MPKIHALYGSIIAVLLLVIAGMGYKFLIAGKTVTAEDKRRAIVLEPAERALILAEMRGFLGAIQIMTEALARGDLKTVATTARPQGMAATRDVPATLAAKLPLEFKSLGHSVHDDFDRIALDAEALNDVKHSLTQLSAMIGKCVACHGAYQLAAVSPEAK